MRLLPMEEYVQMPRPQLDWLIHGLIPRPGLVLLMAPTKAGKTFLAMDVARHVVNGTDFLGHATTKGKAVYIQLDISEPVWVERGRELLRAGIDLPFLVVHPEDAKRPVNILEPMGRAWLKRIADQGPDLVVVDVLREIHTADENDSTEMKIAFDAIVEVFAKCAVLIVHHTKKIPADVTDPNPETYGRGSNYVTGKVDAYWMLHNGKLKIVSRFDPPVWHKAVQDAETGMWTFPNLTQATEGIERVMGLCQEMPDQPHNRLAPIAQDRWGMSRRTYYRYLKGRKCAHRVGG